MKLVTLIILLLSPFVAFADLSDDEKAAKEQFLKQYGKPVESKVQVVETTQASVTDVNSNQEATPSNDPSTEDINTEMEKMGMDAKKIEEMAKGFQGQSLKGSFITKMMNEQMKIAAAKMMKSNPFKDMEDEQVKGMITTVFKEGTPVKNFIDRNPKLLHATVKWIKDERAIPSFISIINKPDKMKYFGYSVLAVFICAFLINLKNSKHGLLKRIFFKMIMMVSTGVINITVFYILFQKELQPSIEVFKTHL